MRSLQGKLLLDGGKLAGSAFHRTVVLVCRHSADGAFGLVLNRVSEVAVADVLDAELPATLADQQLYVGGPVEKQMLSCLAHDPDGNELVEGLVLPGLRLTHTLDELANVRAARFYAGYAGWAPGQLDDELKRDAWLIHPASIELVFHPRPADLWKTILRQKGPQYHLLAESPDDPSRN